MRTARIFISGVAAMAAIAFLLLNLRLALFTFAGTIFFFVIGGFVVPSPRLFSFNLPAISEADEKELSAGIKPQPYPQLFVFRVQLRNLFLLLISPLYSFGLVVFLLTRPDLKWAGSFEWEIFPGPFVQPLAGAITSLAALLAWMWISERVVLVRSAMRLGIVHARLSQEWTYEYFDFQGNRHGDSAFPWNRITHVLMPVFVDRRDGDRSKPGFSFLFHEFEIVESRHFPTEETRR